MVTLGNAGVHPRTVEVSVGTRVTWVNRGKRPNSVQTWHTSDHAFDLHTIRPGEQKSHRFRAPGRYDYFSAWEGGFNGTVLVVVPRR